MRQAEAEGRLGPLGPRTDALQLVSIHVAQGALLRRLFMYFLPWTSCIPCGEEGVSARIVSESTSRSADDAAAT
jgi:hypothetical protein